MQKKNLLNMVFVKFLKKPSKLIYKKPWMILFIALWVYIVEEVSNILDKLGVFHLPEIIYPLFAMVIITSFIYMLLLQKDYLKSAKKTKK